MRNLKDWLILSGFIILSEAAGAIGSIFTFPAIPTWYATLLKPELAPPNWIFGPVWTTLFLLMGIAAYIVFRSEDRGLVKIALGVFAFQFVLNILWSFLFFGLRDPGSAFIEIILLWLAIAATIFMFYRVSVPAALLLVPYIAWVSFAGYLNYLIWILNRGA